MEKEIWKEVKGLDHRYKISNMGNLISFAKHKVHGKKMNPATHKQGYKRAKLIKNGKEFRKFVHVLVMENFTERPPGKYEVNHINGIKDDNRLVNLEWVTAKENIGHAIKTGLVKTPPSGVESRFAKLDRVDVIVMRGIYDAGVMTQTMLGKCFNVSQSVVWKVVKRKAYTNI